MYSVQERLLYYIIGSIAGAILGNIIARTYGSIEGYDSLYIYVVFIIIGLLITMGCVEYAREKALLKDKKIRDEVVTLITHEMRTALTSTGWAIELVLEKYQESLTAGDLQLLKAISNSIHATTIHAVNLLDISVLDIGKLAISLQWITLDKVSAAFTEDVLRYKLGAIKNDITLTSSIELDAKKEAEIDLLRLRIVFENLLENAIQYTVLNKKEIHVSITNDDTSMNILVSDTGIGIPEREKSNIFTEFFRATNARQSLTNGSGIGLYTCFEYIKAHHGTIRFESEENVGTTFFISIPLMTNIDVNGFLKEL